jgi:hypothetical protein
MASQRDNGVARSASGLKRGGLIGGLLARTGAASPARDSAFERRSAIAVENFGELDASRHYRNLVGTLFRPHANGDRYTIADRRSHRRTRYFGR